MQFNYWQLNLFRCSLFVYFKNENCLDEKNKTLVLKLLFDSTLPAYNLNSKTTYSILFILFLSCYNNCRQKIFLFIFIFRQIPFNRHYYFS